MWLLQMLKKKLNRTISAQQDMNILLESEGGHMSTFGMQSTQVPAFFLVFLSTCLTREWGSALCRALLSGIFLGDLLPCHSFHNHLATPSLVTPFSQAPDSYFQLLLTANLSLMQN